MLAFWCTLRMSNVIRSLDFLVLKLQMSLNHHVGSVNQNKVLWKASLCLLPLGNVQRLK